MDNLAYLNQISQSTRPAKPKAGSQSNLPVLITKIAAGAILAFIALLVIGNMIGSASGKAIDLSRQIYVRSTNLQSTLKDYDKQLKSSKLRSIGSALSGTLTNTTNQLSTYLKKDESAKSPLEPKESTVAEEAELSSNLNTSLNNAKLNGILDRSYTNQIQLQVSLLMSLGSELLARTKDPELERIVTDMNTSLQTVHDSLAAYSETNQQ